MERYARWRVLVDGKRVAVDPSGSVAAIAARDVAGGFPVAPERLLARDEGPTVLDVRRTPAALPPVRWRGPGLADVTGPADVCEAVRAALGVFHGETRPPDRRPRWLPRVGATRWSAGSTTASPSSAAAVRAMRCR